LHHHNTTVANHIFNKECRHIYFLLTLFGYKVRKHFKNSLGWWVGFGWLGSFGFAKRWLCVSGQNQMCQMRWQKISFVRWAFFYFFLCRVVVWSGIEVSVRVVVLPLPLTFWVLPKAGIFSTKFNRRTNVEPCTNAQSKPFSPAFGNTLCLLHNSNIQKFV
jgi:hypothetical protein